MKPIFSTIAIIGKPHHQGTMQTLTDLVQWLTDKNYQVIVEQRLAQSCQMQCQTIVLEQIGQIADLAIVIGGDGNMLGAARALYQSNIKVIGVNRGNLGFLTDLSPDDLFPRLEQVLEGHSRVDERFLLEVEVYRNGELVSSNSAMNEAVLHPDKIAHMIEFEVYIDNNFMYSQRADGLIVSTPTGSTAYSLSAGGAILSPSLNAIIINPKFAHSLTARPIVIDGDSTIRIKVSPSQDKSQLISCDGHIDLSIKAGDEILIKKSQKKLQLIHPLDRNDFQVLRSKLGWGSKLF
ncbi:NAD(+) kinase [Paraferrimonas sp. SM1919]|uniref:NAD(+) kinase n=1 Tax=Paraferrimonas sp. SM1919 TaxID=2662263 RepID=UPI0013D60E64|nr:NAD(+) kinase [Paraferrimonas sp. SM1919]